MNGQIVRDTDSSLVREYASAIQASFPSVSDSIGLETALVALAHEAGGNSAELTTLEDSDGDTIRRHREFCALVDIAGIAPVEAEAFVDHWHRSARPTGPPYQSLYTRLERLLTGGAADVAEELTLDAGLQVRRVADGIIWAESGKDACYCLSDDVLRRVPWYLRGNRSAFADLQDARLLVLIFPHVFKHSSPDAAVEYLRQHEGYHYQWFTGSESPRPVIANIESLRREAADHPRAWYPLSYRPATTSDRSRISMPMLTGTQFAAFLESQGNLALSDVRWFETGAGAIAHAYAPRPIPFDRERHQLLREIAPALSPFKRGPMCEIEYDWTVDRHDGGLADRILLFA